MENRNRINKSIRKSGDRSSTQSTTVDSKQYTNTLFSHWITNVLIYLISTFLLSYFGWIILSRSYYYSEGEVIYNITCQVSGNDVVYPSCSPNKCARIIVNEFLTTEQVSQLVDLVKRALEHGRSNGGASIFDFQSGAISKGDKFVNVYSASGEGPVFSAEDFTILYKVIERVQLRIAGYFGINVNNLFLTNPSFFSEMTDLPAHTIHDEYWHTHVDKQTYEAFEYTSLIYLSEQGHDFRGGRFIYEDNGSETGMSIQPKPGLLSIFTSGNENPHRVEKITEGVRYALTIGFTCNPDKRVEMVRTT